MGAFKPLLPFGASTVIETCLDNLQAAGAETVIVVTGYRADELETHLGKRPVTFARNTESGSEMSVSIARGVEKLPPETRAVLVMPADLPAAPVAVIRQIVEAWATAKARLVVPAYEGRGGHPVLASLDFRRDLLELEAQGGLRGFLQSRQEETRRLAVDSSYIRRDLDTWEDYCALHQEICGRPPPSNAAP